MRPVESVEGRPEEVLTEVHAMDGGAASQKRGAPYAVAVARCAHGDGGEVLRVAAAGPPASMPGGEAQRH